ncbi:zinc finger protein 160-like [Thamnophis elegans]|uniref:zinc finger protein 160-like n=1 Tax=Thamnophis elegans TaxID=35005 RepID=UPI001377DDD7|nr:zinc finger protein 160-like [Thamnophis elegans]
MMFLIRSKVPEAFMEVTVCSSDVQRTHLGRRQKTIYKNSVQGNHWTAPSIGRVHCHPPELLSRLDRGEEAWVPPIQSSDESADEGPIKPTLKQLPAGGTRWARYRSPVTYPSSESANSDNDQESEEEKSHRGSYLHRGGFRPTILRRNLFNNPKGSGSQSLKPREAYKHGSQLKKPSQSQPGKTKAEMGNANESSQAKERAAGRDHPVLCSDCGLIFKSKISLANHQRIHTMPKPYKCPDCEERFSSKKVLDRHQRDHRAEAGKRPPCSVVKPQNLKLYECFSCKKSFELKEQFLLHQKSHTTQQSYKGRERGQIFVQKELLDKHKNCHTTPKNNRKKNKKEEKIESTPETEHKKDSTAPVPGSTRSLNIGLTRQQQDQVNLHKCQFCGKCLRFKSLLVDHERMHREPRPYKCSQCSKSFLVKSILMTHMTTHMKQASRKHPKKVKSLAMKSALDDSENSHKRGNSSKRPGSRKIITRSSYHIWHPRKWGEKGLHQCQYCGKYLSTRIILANHEKLHTGERPYKCHECPESFIRKHHLFRHLAIHLRELSNDDAKSLSVKSYHTMRIKSHHYGQKAPEDLLPASDVTRRSGLAKHPKITTQENYVCQHCGKCMRTKSAFVNHGKVHRRKEQPYPHLEHEENTSQEEPLASHQETHTVGKHSLSSDPIGKLVTKNPPTSSHKRKQHHLCQKCGKTFDDNNSFTRHQRIHSGQKPFRCAACGKSFGQMWHLRRHEKTHLKGKFPKQSVVREEDIQENNHLDRKLFKCALCGKGFFQPWHLKRHKRIHLNEECRKLSAVMEVTRAVSNFPSSTVSTEEGRGDPVGKALLQLPLHTNEVIGLPHAQGEERDSLVPLEERSDTGAPEKHMTMPVQLSRKFNENILLAYGEVSQAEKSVRKPRRKDTVSIHQPRTCSKNAHSQSRKKEKNHDGCQLGPGASSIRKSKRETQLVGKRSKRCFCQGEEREMVPLNASNPPKKVKYCDGPERDPCMSVSPSLFQSASKPKDLCLELPCQKTFSREAQMKVTKNVVQRNTVVSVAQERESLEANSGSQSCEKEKYKPSNVRDPAGTRPLPHLSESETQQDHDRFCPLNASSDATVQNLGRAPLAEQLGETPNPLNIQRRIKARRSVELKAAILRKLQISFSKGKTFCDQQMKHVCTRCKKSFRSRTNLLVHEKNHTENRPFPCIHCKKSFFTMTALKIHMRIHTGEKPYKCSECDFCCNVLCNLKRHKATHSQERLQPCMHCVENFWLNPEHMAHLKFSGKKAAYACPDCEPASMHRNLLKRKRKKF